MQHVLRCWHRSFVHRVHRCIATLTWMRSLCINKGVACAEQSNYCTWSSCCTTSSALCTHVCTGLSQVHTYLVPLTELKVMTRRVSNVLRFAFCALHCMKLHAAVCTAIPQTQIIWAVSQLTGQWEQNKMEISRHWHSAARKLARMYKLFLTQIRNWDTWQ